MRLLVVHPGASWSTADVYDGYVAALERRGHELIKYRLDSRLFQAGAFLNMCWRQAGKPRPGYTGADVYYKAGIDLYERIARFQVDGVLIISAMFLHPDHLAFLRYYGVKTAILLTESPYDDEKQARVAAAVDVCWTNERASLPLLRQANPQTYYLPHAYDPDRHHPDAPDEDVPSHDVVFVGTGFQERCEVLSSVDWTGIDLGLYGTWPLLGSRSKLRRHLREGPVPNWRTVELYRRAKIGLNLHRTSKGFGRDVEHVRHAESLNPRAFELAAVGAFQISDYRAELGEVFGSSIPTFRTPDELSGLIRRYLAHDPARATKAHAARNRVAGQTFDARAEQLEGQLYAVWSSERTLVVV